MPHLLLITLAVVILHGRHQPDLEATEVHFRREALQNLQTRQAGDLADGMATKPAVRVLEVSSAMRILELEPAADGLAPATIDRLQGARPLSRCKTAELLETLGQRLQRLGSAGPQVVAIDFDLAPVADGTGGACESNMAAALGALRQTTSVVAIAMSRPDKADRLARNQFWTETAQCTRRAGKAAGQALYLASPQVFHDHVGPPLDFPRGPEASWRGGRDADQQIAFGAVFPSVGNLIGLALTHQPADSAAGLAQVALCEQMVNAPSTACTLEDGLDATGATGQVACQGQDLRHSAAPDGAPVAGRVNELHKQAYNWPLLARQLSFTPLASLAQLAVACEGTCVRDAQLSADVLVLSVDAGGGRDTYLVPNIAPDPVSGAELHALQHLSLLPGQQLHTNSAWGVVADLVAGLLFMAAWAVAKHVLDKLHPQAGLAKVLKAAAPLLLVLGTASLFRHWLSPWLMDLGYWVNPIFVVTGLALHAYAEAWHDANHVASELPDFSFGLARVVHMWNGSTCCRVDACALASLQWAILGGGLYHLVKPGAVHLGWQLALALVVGCGLCGWRLWARPLNPPKEGSH